MLTLAVGVWLIAIVIIILLINKAQTKTAYCPLNEEPVQILFYNMFGSGMNSKTQKVEEAFDTGFIIMGDGTIYGLIDAGYRSKEINEDEKRISYMVPMLYDNADGNIEIKGNDVSGK